MPRSICIDELYPDYAFDVEAGAGEAYAADVIVLRYPAVVYGWPSHKSGWRTCLCGFSHGSTGTALRGKLSGVAGDRSGGILL